VTRSLPAPPFGLRRDKPAAVTSRHQRVAVLRIPIAVAVPGTGLRYGKNLAISARPSPRSAPRGCPL